MGLPQVSQQPERLANYVVELLESSAGDALDVAV